ncbi:pirin family protein [Neisseria leonii]|uniref:Pirin family protein n=1 Tax=Neisseria leonii TaxID=2995413 RepID=A0A9X4E4J7_9NEIS|nr:pirin family protein [Neisseria sp. 51.81]MDD9327871.1 pirin family protein [Neisseria sp. 51.81]
MRRIKQIYRTGSRHWVGDGFWVQPLFSHMGEDRGTDPFLMLDYAAPHEFAPNETRPPRGVGAHPHKGFETVTIAYHGEVAHRDSAGGGGVIREGDVQWMTAGRGIVHEEFHSEAFSRRGGLFEMVQLWVNLPAAFKHTPPRYQHLAKEQIPIVPLAGGAGHLRLIAGEYGGVSGAAETFTPINVWDVQIHAGQTADLAVPSGHRLLMVVLRGQVRFSETDTAEAGQLAVFEDGGDTVSIHAGSGDVKILLLSGEPINEAVAAYGPFVMNTSEEIRQALNDFKHGRFGSIDAHQAV